MDGASSGFCIPLITPATLLLSSRGRVKLCQSRVVSGCGPLAHLTGYLAPEYRPNKHYTDTEAEKMWIFGLGESLKRATLTSHTATSRLSAELCQVLTDMTRPQASSRASLMYLLDVISDYCRRRQQSRPFSHIVMDLHQEAMAGLEMKLDTCWTLSGGSEMHGATRTRYPYSLPPPLQLKPATASIIPERIKMTKEASTSMEDLSPRLMNVPGTVMRPKSMCVPPTLLSRYEEEFVKKMCDNSVAVKSTEKVPSVRPSLIRGHSDVKQSNRNRSRQRRNPVQRAASRLYRAVCDDESAGREVAEKPCVGPEFVVRANLPSKRLTISDSKDNKRTVTVIMLNGQKIEVECNPNSITAGQVFEEIIRYENIEENFMLGLSALIAGDFVFLPSDARICKAVSTTDGVAEITLFMRVRFFLPNLRGLKSMQARHLLYLQIRRSILEYQLPCTLLQLTELGGLALQAEFGDYTEKEHGCRDYFLLEHYVPEIIMCDFEKCRHLKQKLIKSHRNKIGMDAERAEEEFVLLAQTLPHYGGHFYMSTWIQKDNAQKNVWLFISAQGISLYERLDIMDPYGLVLLEMFEWKMIQTLCYSKHYLCIIPHTAKINKLKLKKYKLKMDFKKSYFTFRLASLHHQFFLRLRTEYISLQRLSDAFGVPLKDIKNETNSLYKLETLTNPLRTDLDNNSVNADTEFKIEFHFPSKKGSTEYLTHQRSKSAGDFQNLNNAFFYEEYQNKENENPKKFKHMQEENDTALDNYSLMALQNSNLWDKRRGVKMGVRAFGNNSQRISRSMEAVNVGVNDDLEKFSLQSVSLHYSSSSTRSPMPEIKHNDVYILDASIHSRDTHFLPNLQETLSQSLLDKLDNLSFVEEYFLCSVTIQRDSNGSLGLQITEGSDGKVYVRSVIPGGPADLTNKINRGDQIIAVNQQNLLCYKYEDALAVLRNSGNIVELVLSQVKNSSKLNMEQNITSMKNKSRNLREQGSKLKNSTNVIDLKESRLRMIKLENRIKELKHFSYAGRSGSSFGSSDTPIEKHLTESCYDVTNLNKYPSLHLTNTLTDVPYHKHIRYGFEPEIDCVDQQNFHKEDQRHCLGKMFSKSCMDISNLHTDLLTKDSNKPKFTKEVDENEHVQESGTIVTQKLKSPIALPRSLGLSRKWRGPVKYPVTPVKKGKEISDNENLFYGSTSDEEQVFI